MKGTSDTLQDLQKDGRIFYTIFYYTVLIILGPVLIFFGSKIVVLDGILGLSSTASNVWSALVAVIALHIIVGMYIYRAYSEPGRPAKPDKID